MSVFKVYATVTVVSLGLATFMPGAAASETSAADAEPAKATKEKKVSPNKRVCRKVKPTGSHLPQRVCLKKREWDKMAKAAQQTIRNSTGGSVTQ